MYVWKKRVQPEYLNPPDGICFNILNTAARHGDAQLATDVFRVLGNRQTIFDISQYEMLIDTYVTAGDLKAAFSVLSVMHAAGVHPDETSAHSTRTLLLTSGTPANEALAILEDLHAQARPVPPAAFNCVLEATLDQTGLTGAFERYKMLHTICAAGPDIHTFNLLLRGCRTEQNKDIAMFLAAEMVALNVKPNARTYERLIEVCLVTGEHADARRYYEEMLAQGFRARYGTLRALVNDCVDRRDEEMLWGLLDELPPDTSEFAQLVRHVKVTAEFLPGYEGEVEKLERRVAGHRGAGQGGFGF